MKQILSLLLLVCTYTNTYAQAPQFTEPEFYGDVLAILPNDTTKPLVKESMSPRTRSSTGATLFGIGKTMNEVVVNGPHAIVRLKQADGVAFIMKVYDNEVDPMSMISIFEFKVKKKKQRIAEYASIGTFGDVESNTLNRLPFTARRFGQSSYMIIIQESRLGEFGIIFNDPNSMVVSTFGIDK